jgi:hypothetical protein
MLINHFTQGENIMLFAPQSENGFGTLEMVLFVAFIIAIVAVLAKFVAGPAANQFFSALLG